MCFHLFVQADGLDERFNQTLQGMLRKYVQENKDNWDTYLDTCTFAYNTSRHESSLYTPFEIMFGRKARLPIDIDVEAPSASEVLECTAGEYQDSVEILTMKRRKVLEEVKLNIATAQEKQKKQYDKKHAVPSAFRVGVRVLRKDFTRKKRRGGKMDSKWLGPYMIVKDLGRGLYQLKSVENADDTVKVNGAQLKVYKTSSSTRSACACVRSISCDMQHACMDACMQITFQII